MQQLLNLPLWQTGGPPQTDTGAHREEFPQVAITELELTIAYEPASGPESSSILNSGSGRLEERQKK